MRLGSVKEREAFTAGKSRMQEGEAVTVGECRMQEGEASYRRVSAAWMRQPSLHGSTRGVPTIAAYSSCISGTEPR